MNISPISFKGVTRIVGFRTQASADRICDIINHGETGETKAEQRIVKYFESRKTNDRAINITFNQGKASYVVTGDEYDKISELYDEMAQNVEIASNIYGRGSEMVKLVMESEFEDYINSAKLIVLGATDGAMRVGLNDTTNRINSVDFFV